MRALTVIIFLLLVTLWHLDALGNRPSTSCALSAPSVSSEIRRDGAHKVYDEFAKDNRHWVALKACIASGKAEWIRIASSLYLESDGSGAEDIAIAVGEALGNQPGNILRITQHESSLGLTLEQICAAPNSEDPRFSTYQLSMNEIKKRELAIAAVNDKKLADDIVSCHADLENAKEWVAKTFATPSKAMPGAATHLKFKIADFVSDARRGER